MKKLMLLITAAAALALLAMPGAALAKRGDRNHDGIPDKWEKKFHLSLHVNQAHRDQDRDGLNNKQEFKDGTNPRRADTDGDGLKDGQEVETGNNPKDADTDNNGVDDGEENAGTIASFDPQSGMLVINLANNGGTVSGIVNSSTEIECRTAEEQQQENEQEDNDAGEVKMAEDGGSGDNSGSGSTSSGDGGGSDNSGPGDGSTTSSSTTSSDDGSGDNGSGDDNQQANCGTADLTMGTVVHEAELQLENGQATFEKVELIK
jgi:hypothetical protein